jgi:Tfp pilus assembly protein PilF
MSERHPESAVDRLRKQAERAIAASQGRRIVEPLLERILSLAPDGSEASVFAHRHLAELRIEDHPWRALLHLRKVIGAHPDDDAMHALMGLSQALLANFRAAVSAYRRALALAPRNPWYHHNLGHLLDVALDQPAAALKHLELAHRAAHPPEHEIAASLAHCLARVGRIDEARSLASAAVAAEPRNKEHKQLLAWIERGAPEERGDPRTRRAVEGRTIPARGLTARFEERFEEAPAEPRERRVAAIAPARAPTRGREERKPETRARTEPGVRVREDGADPDVAEPAEAGTAEIATAGAPKEAPVDTPADADPVVPLLERVMREGGFTPEHVSRARRLWTDYRAERAARAQKPDVCAAAIEYAIARLHGLDGVTRASVARRYGVNARSVSERFDDIQIVLALKPDDPRYARC